MQVNTKYPNNESLKQAHLDFPDNMPNGYENYPLLFSKMFQILLEIPKKSYVLDVGCNSGEISRLLRDFRDCRTQGIDISKKVVKKAQSKGLAVVLGDVESLPFKDNTFDCVYLGEMIEHSHRPEVILKEINRVLKPKGKLVGTTVNEEAMSNFWDEDRLHARTYNLETMKKLLSREFTKIKIWNDVVSNMMVTMIFKGYKK